MPVHISATVCVADIGKNNSADACPTSWKFPEQVVVHSKRRVFPAVTEVINVEALSACDNSFPSSYTRRFQYTLILKLT